MRITKGCNRSCCIVHITPDNLNEDTFPYIFATILVLAVLNLVALVFSLFLAYSYKGGWYFSLSLTAMVFFDIFICPSEGSRNKMKTAMPDYFTKVSKLKIGCIILTVISGSLFVAGCILSTDESFSKNDTNMPIPINLIVVLSLNVLCIIAFCVITIMWVTYTRQAYKYVLTKVMINRLPQESIDRLNAAILKAALAIPQEQRITLNGVQYVSIDKIYPIPTWLEKELSEHEGISLEDPNIVQDSSSNSQLSDSQNILNINLEFNIANSSDNFDSCVELGN